MFCEKTPPCVCLSCYITQFFWSKIPPPTGSSAAHLSCNRCLPRGHVFCCSSEDGIFPILYSKHQTPGKYSPQNCCLSVHEKQKIKSVGHRIVAGQLAMPVINSEEHREENTKSVQREGERADEGEHFKLVSEFFKTAC